MATFGRVFVKKCVAPIRAFIATVTKVLRRLGLNRLTALDPPIPVVRYQRAHPGELLHLDTKKLGRIAGIGHRITGRRTGAINRHHGIGWECLHVCIDDACRLAYSEVLPDERKETATAFLRRRQTAYRSDRGIAGSGPSLTGRLHCPDPHRGTRMPMAFIHVENSPTPMITTT